MSDRHARFQAFAAVTSDPGAADGRMGRPHRGRRRRLPAQKCKRRLNAVTVHLTLYAYLVRMRQRGPDNGAVRVGLGPGSVRCMTRDRGVVAGLALALAETGLRRRDSPATCPYSVDLLLADTDLT